MSNGGQRGHSKCIGCGKYPLGGEVIVCPRCFHELPEDVQAGLTPPGTRHRTIAKQVRKLAEKTARAYFQENSVEARG